MEVSVCLRVSLEIAQKDKAGLREEEMLMWTKVWSTVCICVTVCVCVCVCVFVSVCVQDLSLPLLEVCVWQCVGMLSSLYPGFSFLQRPLWKYVCVLQCMSVCKYVCVVCAARRTPFSSLIMSVGMCVCLVTANAH